MDVAFSQISRLLIHLSKYSSAGGLFGKICGILLSFHSDSVFRFLELLYLFKIKSPTGTLLYDVSTGTEIETWQHCVYMRSDARFPIPRYRGYFFFLAAGSSSSSSISKSIYKYKYI